MLVIIDNEHIFFLKIIFKVVFKYKKYKQGSYDMWENMIEIIDYLRNFNLFSIIFRLFLATLLSGCIGTERSKMGRAAGLRTHILVCVGATISAMTGQYLYEYYNLSGDVTRIAAQVISGIGFLGAGTILVKHKSIVTGLTTAACVWATGSIGIAVGYGFYEAAIIGGILILLTTWKLGVIDKKVNKNTWELNLYMEFENAKLLNNTLKEIEKKNCIIENINLVKSKTKTPNGIGAEMMLLINKNKDKEKIIEQLNDIENINFAISIYNNH
jgi:putative Mg2+ transporter-C (MgtC) family protein